MFKIWFVNFQYYSSETFDTLIDAVVYGKYQGFEFRVDRNDKPVYAWSPIGGGREM